MPSKREFVSLDEIVHDRQFWIGGVVFDPVFDAVAANEENDHGFWFVGASMLDWDEFSVTHAAFNAMRNAQDRKDRALHRDGRPPKVGKPPQKAPDIKCPSCGIVFRPFRSAKVTCSKACALLLRTMKSKHGAMIDRIQKATGMSRKDIWARIGKGWSEEKCLSAPIRKVA